MRGMARKTKSRTVAWTLSREEVLLLVRQRCHYCDSEPSQVKHSNGRHQTVFFNGIDRLDSDCGYIQGNVVPCCKWCNFAKNTQSYPQFKEWVKRTYRNLFKASKATETAQNLNLFDRDESIQ